MDFWNISIDDALSGAPIPTASAEKELVRFASGEVADDTSTLTTAPTSKLQSLEEVDASTPSVQTSASSKKEIGSKKKSKDVSKDGKSVSLKDAYFEVKKFAISGMEGSKKEDANVRLATSLGAKPKKKKYVNYKELKQERSDAKKAAVENPSMRVRGGGVKKKKSKKTGKKLKKSEEKNRRKRNN